MKKLLNGLEVINPHFEEGISFDNDWSAQYAYAESNNKCTSGNLAVYGSLRNGEYNDRDVGQKREAIRVLGVSTDSVGEGGTRMS